MPSKSTLRITAVALAFSVGLSLFNSPAAFAGTRLKDICRVKGQEENTLVGLGLVVGLNGSGDGGKFLPAIRSLATALQLMGNPIGPGGAIELKDAKNIALVTVTAKVPAAGGRQGDRLECTVSSIGAAKSLVGGRLMLTPLQGPDVESTRVYAFASGAIELDNDRMPTSGRIHGGCQLEEDFFHQYIRDGLITLVLDENHADFEIAQAVADAINKTPFGLQSERGFIARAANQQNVLVMLLDQYQQDPVDYISQILGLEILLEPEVTTDSRVVINERAGSIVIDGDIEIGAVAVSHANVIIDTEAPPTLDRFVPISPQQEQVPTKLKALVDALNAVKVPTVDIIEIIKQIDRSGKLHGKLIIQ